MEIDNKIIEDLMERYTHNCEYIAQRPHFLKGSWCASEYDIQVPGGIVIGETRVLEDLLKPLGFADQMAKVKKETLEKIPSISGEVRRALRLN